MTNADAIKVLKEELEYGSLSCSIRGSLALELAIHALEQEPCEDCISRQAVLDLVVTNHTELNGVNVVMYSPFCKDIKQLSPVTPKAKSDVLDKIRAEIEQNAYPIVHGVNNHEKGMTLYGILQTFDKYKMGGKE